MIAQSFRRLVPLLFPEKMVALSFKEMISISTLQDVADLAHVAPITVSRVINNPGSVKEATREKVKKAMAAVQYIPNVAAKNLATNRSGIIDVFVPENIDLSNPFVMHLIAGISEVLSEHMYSFLILRNRQKEHLCDGYIVTGLLKNEIREFYSYAEERSRPVVLFGHTALPDVDCIDVDNILGSKMAVEYLIQKGHEKIAMINVDENKDYTADRLEGYKSALREHGLPVDESSITYAPNNVDGGMKAAEMLLSAGGFTAVFCATDTMAIGAAASVSKAGLKVPEDISLVGFDGLGHQLLAAPILTSVQQPIFEMGRKLARDLLERLDGRKEKISELISPILIEGFSVSDIRSDP
jgi:DNA-binding LacI/PurR family transcriptional regulator